MISSLFLTENSLPWTKESTMKNRISCLLKILLPGMALLFLLLLPLAAAQGDMVLVTYKYDRAGG